LRAHLSREQDAEVRRLIEENLEQAKGPV
jgi:hypothetical protein